jgi:hypothetical protein
MIIQKFSISTQLSSKRLEKNAEYRLIAIEAIEDVPKSTSCKIPTFIAVRFLDT